MALWLPSAGGGGAVLLVHDGGGLDDAARDAAERLARAGYAVLAPDLEAEAGAFDDRATSAALESALERLLGEPGVDADELALVGLGAGGTQAFLFACKTRRRLAALVTVGAPVRYAELSSAHPVQPLEMALNLEAQLLAVAPEAEPGLPPEDVAALEQALARFAKPGEVARTADREEAWTPILAFLQEVL